MHAEGQCHVCSLVVHVRAALEHSATRAIGAIPGAAVRASDGSGKLVVLLEAEDEHHILAAFRRIELLEGVLSVALVYHQFDAA